LEPGARAAEKAVFAVRACEELAAVAPGGFATRVLVAHGAEHVRIAWEILLREPTAFTHAVLEGPSPPAWTLLDRGAERLKTRVITAEDDESIEEALRRAAR
jgi:hypothetical protein